MPKSAAAEAGLNEDMELARPNPGQPIEVLDKLELLAEARLLLIRSRSPLRGPIKAISDPRNSRIPHPF